MLPHPTLHPLFETLGYTGGYAAPLRASSGLDAHPLASLVHPGELAGTEY